MKYPCEREKTEIEKCCAYCEKSTKLSGEDYVLCSKRGVVAESYLCRKFAYDPMKVVPKRLPPLPQLEGIEEESD